MPDDFLMQLLSLMASLAMIPFFLLKLQQFFRGAGWAEKQTIQWTDGKNEKHLPVLVQALPDTYVCLPHQKFSYLILTGLQ